MTQNLTSRTLSESASRAIPTHLREQAERNLSALVITVEFTLISVMVGVILSVLVTAAAPILRDLQYEYWLYLVSGLVLVLFLWTEVVTHSLAFIGWPMEFGHNLLYILFAAALAIQMNFLADPVGWFALSTVSSGMATITVLYDRHVIARRQVGAHGAAAEMFQLAMTRQRGLIRTAPITLFNALLTVALVLVFNDFFMGRHFHLILIVAQIIAILILLARTIRTFESWTRPILYKAVQELGVDDDES